MHIYLAVGTNNMTRFVNCAAFWQKGQTDIWVVTQATYILLSRFQGSHTVVTGWILVQGIPQELTGHQGTLLKDGLPCCEVPKSEEPFTLKHIKTWSLKRRRVRKLLDHPQLILMTRTVHVAKYTYCHSCNVRQLSLPCQVRHAIEFRKVGVWLYEQSTCIWVLTLVCCPGR